MERHDALAVAAQVKGMINGPKHRRRDVAVAIQKHQAQVLHQGPFDFPLDCPPKTQLDGFLNLSFLIEQEIVPKFASLPEISQEHRSSFWNDVNKHKFCWINTTATLELDVWKQFFEQFRN